ncbi:hypothetical protein [Paenibacillus senegalimassiliensis]|uniref:hypothetical protein n=1 Tax=Paenibacillus senegalimassiliensis TaxID=1737426 RepID=UPI00073EA9A8|nr:hypothetical protein [Paenibacillus senegalimassiliensis]
MFLYNKQRAAKLLNTVPIIHSIQSASKVRHFECPYDKLIVCSYKLPTPQFIDLIRPARFETDDDETFYHYRLVHELFSVQWMQMNPQAPATTIMLNPWKHQLSPEDVLALIDFIVGSHLDARVAHNDDKLDWLKLLSSKDLAKQLYVGYQKKPPRNYDNLDQTFMFGSKKGGQVIIYDKAKEQGYNAENWTRLEKSRKRRDKHIRPTVSQFLLNHRNDALKNVIIVDTDKFSGKDKIMRRIGKYGTFQEAYMSLTKEEKRKLRRHAAFQSPFVDVSDLFKQELDQWLSLSPRLHVMSKIYSVLQESWSGKEKLSNRAVAPLQTGLDTMSFVPSVASLEAFAYGNSKYQLRNDYFADVLN